MSIISIIVDLVGDVKLTKDSKPPLPKVHSTPKKPSIPKVTEIKKPTEKLIKNAKSSPRITPKATPLQSPGVEHVPLIRETTAEIIKQNEDKEAHDVKLEDKNEEKKDQGTEKTQVIFVLYWFFRINNFILYLQSEINILITFRYNFFKHIIIVYHI